VRPGLSEELDTVARRAQGDRTAVRFGEEAALGQVGVTVGGGGQQSLVLASLDLPLLARAKSLLPALAPAVHGRRWVSPSGRRR